jgi:DNA-binding transcriptional LysR family regulator
LFWQELSQRSCEAAVRINGEQLERLRDGRIQVAFIGLPVRDENWAKEVVKEEPLSIALPNSHPLSRSKQLALTALAREPIILFPRAAAPGLHDLITVTCKNAGVILNVVHEADSIGASLTLVRANLGIAFSVASMQSKSADVVFRPIKDGPRVQYGMVYKRAAQLPVLNSFLKTVRQVIADTRLPAEG